MLVALVALVTGTSFARADTPRWKQLSPPPAMPAPVASGDLPVDDFTLHWAAYGDAKAPPVVLLHGGFGSADDFAAQVPELAKTFRVIAVDSRGHGRSTRSAHGVTYHLMAEDVIALLDHLKVDQAALVGWSDGGIVALDVAMHHPARVTRLAVTGTNYARTGSKPAGKGTPFDAYYARCVAEYKRLAPDPKQLAAFRKDLRAMWKREPAYTDDEIRAITAPLLVLHGERDEIIEQDHVEHLVALVPDAKLVVLAGVSHFAMWQDPAAFNKVLLAFLRAPARR
ncbi:MAG TPA: alpha/beta fold hydrolase [Kofleriaceae bacterium]|nr:alpha/beta fold hydrolase [Kofleriaceae bacterium]